MFVKKDKKISEKKINSHLFQFNNYLNDFVAPDIIAYYIATGYYNSSIHEQSYEKLLNTCYEYIDFNLADKDLLLNNIKHILNIKYNLNITSLNPLNLEPYYKKTATNL